MLTISSLILFTTAFFFISITPGMCMTLALTLGMAIGVPRTRWMMLGELAGVSFVVIVSSIGIASLMLKHPQIFQIGKYLGGLYLLFLAWQLWCSKGKMSVNEDDKHYQTINNKHLISQGFVTAIVNPKGWAFFIALIPPFLNPNEHLIPQLAVFLSIIIVIEIFCLHIYAYGGSTLKTIFIKKSNVRVLNRIAGVLMAFVAIWLALS